MKILVKGIEIVLSPIKGFLTVFCSGIFIGLLIALFLFLVLTGVG